MPPPSFSASAVDAASKTTVDASKFEVEPTGGCLACVSRNCQTCRESAVDDAKKLMDQKPTQREQAQRIPYSLRILEETIDQRSLLLPESLRNRVDLVSAPKPIEPRVRENVATQVVSLSPKENVTSTNNTGAKSLGSNSVSSVSTTSVTTQSASSREGTGSVGTHSSGGGRTVSSNTSTATTGYGSGNVSTVETKKDQPPMAPTQQTTAVATSVQIPPENKMQTTREHPQLFTNLGVNRMPSPVDQGIVSKAAQILTASYSPTILTKVVESAWRPIHSPPVSTNSKSLGEHVVRSQPQQYSKIPVQPPMQNTQGKVFVRTAPLASAEASRKVSAAGSIASPTTSRNFITSPSLTSRSAPHRVVSSRSASHRGLEATTKVTADSLRKAQLSSMNTGQVKVGTSPSNGKSQPRTTTPRLERGVSKEIKLERSERKNNATIRSRNLEDKKFIKMLSRSLGLGGITKSVDKKALLAYLFSNLLQNSHPQSRRSRAELRQRMRVRAEKRIVRRRRENKDISGALESMLRENVTVDLHEIERSLALLEEMRKKILLEELLSGGESVSMLLELVDQKKRKLAEREKLPPFS